MSYVPSADALESIDALFSAYKIRQDKLLFKATEKHEKELHRAEIKLSRNQFSASQSCDKQTHLIETFREMQLHFEQLNSDLVAEAKMNELDMFDHRNQQFSNVLVTAAIMIGALVSCLGQGVLHEDSVQFPILSLIYSVTTSLATAFLFLCTVACIEVMERASNFMKQRTAAYRSSLENAIARSRKMVDVIRDIKLDERRIVMEDEMNRRNTSPMNRGDHLRNNINYNNTNRNRNGNGNGNGNRHCYSELDSERDRSRSRSPVNRHRRYSRSYDDSGNGHGHGNGHGNDNGFTTDNTAANFASSPTTHTRNRNKNSSRRKISKMNDSELEEEFLNHENVFHDCMNVRENLVESSMFTLSKCIENAEFAAGQQTFHEFWSKSCHKLGIAAILLFYLGSLFMIMANLTFMWCTYEFRYNSYLGSEICFHTVVFTLTVSAGLLTYLRTEKLNFRNDDEEEGDGEDHVGDNDSDYTSIGGDNDIAGGGGVGGGAGEQNRDLHCSSQHSELEYSFAHIEWLDVMRSTVNAFWSVLSRPFVGCRRYRDGYTSIHTDRFTGGFGNASTRSSFDCDAVGVEFVSPIPVDVRATVMGTPEERRNRGRNNWDHSRNHGMFGANRRRGNHGYQVCGDSDYSDADGDESVNDYQNGPHSRINRYAYTHTVMPQRSGTGTGTHTHTNHRRNRNTRNGAQTTTHDRDGRMPRAVPVSGSSAIEVPVTSSEDSYHPVYATRATRVHI